jgi:hypothetical protein
VSYTAPDYMDDLNRVLGVSLSTDNVEMQAEAAVDEVARLQGIEKLLRDNREHIIGALDIMQDIDDSNEREADAKLGREIIEKLKNLPDQRRASDYEDQEEEDMGIKVRIKYHDPKSGEEVTTFNGDEMGDGACAEAIAFLSDLTADGMITLIDVETIDSGDNFDDEEEDGDAGLDS